MNVYDAVMKGPPRWARISVVILIVGLMSVQVGIYHGRNMAVQEAIGQTLATKDRELGIIKQNLSDVAWELVIEREKLSILTCESGIRHEGIWGDGGKSYGIAQFQEPTFRHLKQLAGKPDLVWWKKNDQIWLLDWSLRNGYGRYWTCYQKGGGA